MYPGCLPGAVGELRHSETTAPTALGHATVFTSVHFRYMGFVQPNAVCVLKSIEAYAAGKRAFLRLMLGTEWPVVLLFRLRQGSPAQPLA